MEQHLRADWRIRGTGRPDHRRHLHRRHRRAQVGDERLSAGAARTPGDRQGDVGARIGRLSPEAIEQSLRETGWARTGPLLGAPACRELIACFEDDRTFRKRVSMERHRFGAGEYGYFADPLPPDVAALREGLYRVLAPIASRLQSELGERGRYPEELAGFRARCARVGQRQPTPLLLRYRAGGYNRLHQDLYGDLAFPLQATVLLSDPERDFTGGEFLLVENRPRQQSIGSAVALARGEAVVFPVAERPVAGARGTLRAKMRHGMSRLHSGERFALGIIFHDAR